MQVICLLKRGVHGGRGVCLKPRFLLPFRVGGGGGAS